MAENADAARANWRWRAALLRRSLVVRVVFLIIIFVAVPVVLYEQFRAADAERQELLLSSVREKGSAIARALTPLLSRPDGEPFVRAGEDLARFQAGTSASLKLLVRPAGARDDGFFYVASAPPVAAEALESERRSLIASGALQRLSPSCSGDVPLALRVDLPGGRSELLTSVTPITTDRGCWALVVSSDQSADRSIGKPYWRSREVIAAAIIYVIMAGVVLLVFFDLWRSLLRLGHTARAVRAGGGDGRFSDHNTIPELDSVATEFDRMVATLRDSAASIRHAAEDTAHSFKTPIGIIRQAMEPLRRRMTGDTRATESIAAIETALERLDSLVQSAKGIDRAAADLLDPPRERIDFSEMVCGLIAGYRAGLKPAGPMLIDDIERNVTVIGGEELIETAIENVIDNALDFTPPGKATRVQLRRRRGAAVLIVEDDGPGVPPDRMEKIFERYYSDRSTAPARRDAQESFGVGLWIVRRNIEALGGRVNAYNRPVGGLRMEIDLPAA